jgi:hypothetical protein
LDNDRLRFSVAFPRAVETRGAVEPRNRAGCGGDPKGRRQSGWCAVTTTDAGPRTEVQEPFRVAYVTDEETSSARPARRTSLFGNPTFGGSAGDQKSPLRRCFKPRPLVENERKPVASDRRSWCGVDPLRFLTLWGLRPRRLSGLLSGCPPTGTQPQARAN